MLLVSATTTIATEPQTDHDREQTILFMNMLIPRPLPLPGQTVRQARPESLMAGVATTRTTT
jgi:hypothetical protein